MKVLLLGYYGFRNIGDDLFVRNLVNYLTKRNNTVRLICNEDYYTPRFPNQESIEVVRSDQLSKLSRLSLIATSDLIAWGGGTLQLDQKPNNLILTRQLSRVLGKKFGFLGVGLEGSQLENSQLNKSVKTLFRQSNFLYLRDHDSYHLACEELKSPSNSISLGGDLAFLDLDLYQPFMRRTSQSDIKNLSFTGKHWWGKGRAEFYAKPLLQLIEKYDTQIHLLPGSMNKDLGDNAFHERLKAFLPDSNCVMHTWESPEEFLEILGRMDFHIGNRLHSLIPADILGVPNIGINGSPPKIRAYIHKTSLLSEVRSSEFMKEITLDRINKIHQEYERPVSFIEQESLTARQCLERIFAST